MAKSAERRRSWAILTTLAIALAGGACLALFGPGLIGTSKAMAQDSKTEKPASPDAAKDAKEASAGAPQSPPPALVRLGAASQSDIRPHAEIIGRLREVRRVTVGIGQQGKVIKVPVEEGQKVEGGKTVLARVDPTFSNIAQEAVQSQLKQANADEKEAAALLAQAKSDLNYFEELAKTQSARQREVDNAKSAEQAAEARLDRTQAAVLYARAEIERTVQEHIRYESFAPFDGIVVRKWMEEGQWVQKGAPVVEIISRGQIDAIVDVPEKLIADLSTSSDVEVLVESLGRRVNGKIEAIIPDATNVARTFPVKIRLDDMNGKLMPGMSVTAWLPAGDKQPTLTVPRDAVLSSAAGHSIWVAVDKDGAMIALKLEVDVLFGVGDQYAVRVNRRNAGTPLTPGMKVIIEGGERILFPGQPLMLLESR
ncbi:MAG: efflux RND transporter periplasmic adaptor subunit [Phycisphaeraceae bacterium]